MLPMSGHWSPWGLQRVHTHTHTHTHTQSSSVALQYYIYRLEVCILKLNKLQISWCSKDKADKWVKLNLSESIALKNTGSWLANQQTCGPTKCIQVPLDQSDTRNQMFISLLWSWTHWEGTPTLFKVFLVVEFWNSLRNVAGFCQKFESVF